LPSIFRVPIELNEKLEKLTGGDKQKREALLVRALTQAVDEATKII
jgi:predicted transcriptional regulator